MSAFPPEPKWLPNAEQRAKVRALGAETVNQFVKDNLDDPEVIPFALRLAVEKAREGDAHPVLNNCNLQVLS